MPRRSRQPKRGKLLDAKTLAFALTDSSLSLERAAAAFDVPYAKRPVELGHITDELIAYCREDVAATSDLLHALHQEFALHPIPTDPVWALSPASIGKGYLDAMGVAPILERQPGFDPRVLGWGMAAYFGGRAECRIRHWPLPVMYLDFLSMYPTVNALMNTWSLVIAERIETTDRTTDVTALLQRDDLADLFFDPASWPELLCLVEIEPDGDIVPVRAHYGIDQKVYGIGVNPFRSTQGAWYPLADLVASKIACGRTPKIRRAVGLVAIGVQPGLKPIKIRGMVEVDPRRGDFYRQLIELRWQVKNDPDLPEIERDRLVQVLKVIANSTGYGIFAEMNPEEQPEPSLVEVFADGDASFTASVTTPENPGKHCFSPLAACITGAARLMLALLEHEVASRQGSYVFCDTDSMGIVATKDGGLLPCPGGALVTPDGAPAVLALRHDECLGIVERFRQLSPYDPAIVTSSILKIEDENYGEDGQLRELWCWAISAKRYVLLDLDPRTATSPVTGINLVKASESGLGYLLDPRGKHAPSSSWVTDAWCWMINREFGLGTEDPEWLDRPALTQFTVSNPTILRWFDEMNKAKPYPERIKPGNFILVAHPVTLDNSGIRPVAPFGGDADEWHQLKWIDRETSKPCRITTAPPDGLIDHSLVNVMSMRDVLTRHSIHPETKSLDPSGERVMSFTAGVLQRRPVEAASDPRRVGKESNHLEDLEAGVIDYSDDTQIEYIDNDRWKSDLDHLLLSMTVTQVAISVGIDRKTVSRWRNGRTRPHPQAARRLGTLAAS